MPTQKFHGSSSARVQLMVEALKRHGPITAHALAQLIDLPLGTVSNAISDIRSKSPGFIRVASYECNISVYEWSAEADIPRPKRLRQPGWTQRHRESLVPPRPQIPRMPMPPLVWLTTQPMPQLSLR